MFDWHQTIGNKLYEVPKFLAKTVVVRRAAVMVRKPRYL